MLNFIAIFLCSMISCLDKMNPAAFAFAAGLLFVEYSVALMFCWSRSTGDDFYNRYTMALDGSAQKMTTSVNCLLHSEAIKICYGITNRR